MSLILLIDFKVKATPAKQTVKPYNCNQKLKELNVSMLQEFKEFAIKGNAIDMAVGIIVGAAFGKIISSLVADVFMPPVGAYSYDHEHPFLSS